MHLLLQREVPARCLGEAQGRVLANPQEEQGEDEDEGLWKGGD